MSGSDSPFVSNDGDQCFQSLDLGGQTELFENGNHRNSIEYMNYLHINTRNL